MKYIGLIITVLMMSLTGFKSMGQDIKDSELFENITNIEKLVQKNSNLTPQSTTTVATPKMSENFNHIEDTSLVKLNMTDNLVTLDSKYPRSENGTLQLYDPIIKEIPTWMTLRDTIIVDPLFLPVIFRGEILPDDLDFYPSENKYKYTGLLLPEEETFQPRLAHAEFMRRRRLDYYRENPDKIVYSVSDFDDVVLGSDKDVIETYNPFKELISTETSFSLKAPTIDGAIVKRKYWTYNGNHSLHFSQNYFSPNWHKGGTDNFNINTTHALKFNYRKNKVKFNNTVEMRLALMTTPDDTLRSFKINDDLIRYSGDFGVDAFGKHWSYSSNLDARTQFFKNYPVNSKDIQSAFLAPLDIKGGIGLRYNLEKKSEKVRHRKINISFSFDPASISYRYVGNEDVNKKRYGIEEGKKHKLDIGSTITGNMTFNFNRYINLNTRFVYFTSYHKVETELENTLNMDLTNAFSTRLFIHLRFDDGVPADPKFKYLQVTELLSFGLNYKW